MKRFAGVTSDKYPVYRWLSAPYGKFSCCPAFGAIVHGPDVLLSGLLARLSEMFA
ncbi:MAG: hypothetical protein WA705_07000 [Candidatus Ozemobacteraceae bacterium]